MPDFDFRRGGEEFRITADDQDQALAKLQAIPAKQKPTVWSRMYSYATGEGRTEYPEAEEFLQAFVKSGAAQHGGDASAIMRSAITADPESQLDILRKNMPNLQSKRDKFGNVMVRAEGMGDWAYLNKPGFSQRDVDEFLTPILATLPVLGMAGQGANLPARMVTGVVGSGGAELVREGEERAAGSEKQFGAGGIGFSSLFGALGAPGVPSSAVGSIANTIRQWFGGPTKMAEKKIAGAFRDDIMTQEAREAAAMASHAGPGMTTQPGAPPGTALGSQAPRYAPRRPGEPFTPETLQAEGASRVQGKAGPAGAATYGEEARLMDVGGANTTALARSAANLNPSARQTMMDVIEPRMETQADRAVTFVEGLIGQTAHEARDVLEQRADSIVSPAYKAAMQEGARGIAPHYFSELAGSNYFMKATREAVQDMKERAAAGRMETSPTGPGGFTLEFWDMVKRRLQDDEKQLLRGGRQSEAANVGNIRRKLVDVLDTVFPKYKDARSIAEKVFDGKNALDAGEKFVTSRLKNEEAKRALAQMGRDEIELFRTGYVTRLIEVMREPNGIKNLVRTFEGSPALRERFAVALGEDGAKTFEAFLLTEKMMGQVGKAMQNSTTARQLVELGLAGGAGGVASGLDPNNWQTAVIVGFITKYLTHGAVTAYDKAVAQRIATALVSRDPTVYRRGLTTLSDPKWLTKLRKADKYLPGILRGIAFTREDAQQPQKPTPQLVDKALSKGDQWYRGASGL